MIEEKVNILKIYIGFWGRNKSSKQSCRSGKMRIVRYWQNYKELNRRLTTWRMLQPYFGRM
jgi:hypothetical protein